MMPYGYIMILYVLFRVVLSAWRGFLEKRVKFAKYHERLFYSPFRVVVSSLALPFRVVILPGARPGAASTRTFVLVRRFAKKPVKNTKYNISCSHFPARRLPGLTTRKNPNLKTFPATRKTLDNGLALWYNESAIGQTHRGSAKKVGRLTQAAFFLRLHEMANDALRYTASLATRNGYRWTMILATRNGL